MTVILGIHQKRQCESNEHKPDLEEGVQKPFGLDASREENDDSNPTQSTQDEIHHLSQSNESITISHKEDFKTKFSKIPRPTNTQTLNANGIVMTNNSSLNVSQDILKQSLERMTESLEEIKKANEIDFKETNDNKGDQCEETCKCLKELKEAMKRQHRETRRRLQRLEKKTN